VKVVQMSDFQAVLSGSRDPHATARAERTSLTRRKHILDTILPHSNHLLLGTKYHEALERRFRLLVCSEISCLFFGVFPRPSIYPFDAALTLAYLPC
jgi:hypothetical protein